jgi:hypothetical protein
MKLQPLQTAHRAANAMEIKHKLFLKLEKKMNIYRQTRRHKQERV